MNCMLQRVEPDHDDIAWIGPEHARRVREGFQRVAADAEGFATEFYETLFGIAPATRRMFPEDMAEQRRKLLRMLTLLTSSLDKPELLRDSLRNLGERHYRYGVMGRDYHPVGQALLSSLASRLGDGFTSEDRRAWADLYVRISAMMQGRHRP